MLILSISSWWSGMETYPKILFIIACAASLVLLVQLIIALFGFGDTGGDMSGDYGGDADIGGGDGDAGDIGDGDAGAGLRVFTVQGVVSFFVMFAWSGFAFIQAGVPDWLSSIIAFILGAATLLLMAKLMQLMMRLQSSGNVTMAGAVGMAAQVYIPIPPEESGIGKVTLTYQGRFMECNAITKGGEMLKTDSFVKVVEVRGTTLIVEKATPPEKEGKEKPEV